ncbi:hypothetical protein BH11ARM2_BH11ARM2_01930 [soil metagenome]
MLGGYAFYTAPANSSATAAEIKATQTATFTWIDDGSDEPPPEAVAICQIAYVDAERELIDPRNYGYDPEPLDIQGSLGLSIVAWDEVGNHSSYDYTLVKNPGQNFMVTWTPNITVVPFYADDEDTYINVWCDYTISCTPIKLDIRGATQDGDDLRALIGQEVVATVKSQGLFAPIPTDVKIEATNSHIFKAYYDTQTSSGTLIPLDAPGSVFKFFGKKKTNNDGLLITAKFKFPNKTTVDTLERRVILDEPTFTVSNQKIGYVTVKENIQTYRQDANGNLVPDELADEAKLRCLNDPVINSNGSTLTFLHGFQITASVTFPALYGIPDTGLWFFRQMVTPNSVIYRKLTKGKIKDTQGLLGLDFGLYLPTSFKCNSGPRPFFDSPGVVLPHSFVYDATDPIESVSIDADLSNYVMFRPPANDTEVYSVPLFLQPWSAKGSATKLSQGGGVGSSGPSTLPATTKFPPHPQWTVFHFGDEPIEWTPRNP